MMRHTDKSCEVKPLTLVVLSGGTGRTAEGVLGAALAQFDHENVRVVREVGVRTIRNALEVVRRADADGAILCHSLVDPTVRDAVVREIARRMVPAIDVLGPALAVLEDNLNSLPKGRAGLSYELNREQFRRIDAADFTLAHDDGARLQDIDQANVILVGVSRVAKSVTCLYLSYRGIRAANVPLVSGCPAPPELLEIDPRKIIGLTMNAQRLQAVRSTRIDRMSMGPVDNYVDIREIGAELRHARHLMDEHRWRCIDVSYTAIEEIAKEITHMIGE